MFDMHPKELLLFVQLSLSSNALSKKSHLLFARSLTETPFWLAKILSALSADTPFFTLTRTVGPSRPKPCLGIFATLTGMALVLLIEDELIVSTAYSVRVRLVFARDSMNKLRILL